MTLRAFYQQTNVKETLINDVTYSLEELEKWSVYNEDKSLDKIIALQKMWEDLKKDLV